uniref:Uncharacterized protein n=1 Tax=Panagrolaimus sp. JU765 TaxID=591449 RepID=A0AC34PVZ6_9BILA
MQSYSWPSFEDLYLNKTLETIDETTENESSPMISMNSAPTSPTSVEIPQEPCHATALQPLSEPPMLWPKGLFQPVLAVIFVLIILFIIFFVLFHRFY